MPDPLKIHLTPFQQKFLTSINTEIQRARERWTAAVAAIVAGQADLDGLVNWEYDVQDTQILLSPPAEPVAQ